MSHLHMDQVPAPSVIFYCLVDWIACFIHYGSHSNLLNGQRGSFNDPDPDPCREANSLHSELRLHLRLIVFPSLGVIRECQALKQLAHPRFVLFPPFPSNVSGCILQGCDVHPGPGVSGRVAVLESIQTRDCLFARESSTTRNVGCTISGLHCSREEGFDSLAFLLPSNVFLRLQDLHRSGHRHLSVGCS